jgi:hypothetical protein
MKRTLFTLAFGALAACRGASPSSAASEAMIGPRGGELAAPGLVLRVPQGALRAAHPIAIKTRPTAPASALSPVYHFTPSGLHFSTGILVELEAAPGRHPVVYWSSETQPGFDKIYPQVVGDKLLVNVVHFSDGWVGEDDQPPPPDMQSDPLSSLCNPGANCCDGLTLDPANPACGDATDDITGCHGDSDCVDAQHPICCSGFCQVSCGGGRPGGCASSADCPTETYCCPGSGACALSCYSGTSGSAVVVGVSGTVLGSACGSVAADPANPDGYGCDTCPPDAPICYRGMCVP